MTTQHTPGRLYADRDIINQGPHYVAHVSAMTKEALHSKSDIAAELAHRDIVIAELMAALKNLMRGIFDGPDESDATANPATVIALLDRLEAAEKDAATRLIQPMYQPLPEDRENGCKPFDPQARIQELEEELRDQRIAAAVRGMG